MIDKFKQWLGIEGVKVQILLPEEIKKESGFVDGRIVIHSKHNQTVTSIYLSMIEIYTRGRGKDQKIDEYKVGEIEMNQDINISPSDETNINFELPFSLTPSDMDVFENKNLITKGLSKAAKALQQVESSYRIDVLLKVKGTALDPFDSLPIKLT